MNYELVMNMMLRSGWTEEQVEQLPAWQLNEEINEQSTKELEYD